MKKTAKTIFEPVYVKNLNAITCFNCKHLMIDYYDVKYSRCNKFAEKNLVTGKIDFEFAQIVRQYGPCGINAKYKNYDKTPFIYHNIKLN
jgi:hypothetical protein